MAGPNKAWWTIVPAWFAVLSTTAYSRQIRYYFNAVLYILALGLCSVVGVVFPLTFGLFGQRYNTNLAVARSFYALSSRLFGITVKIVEGEQYLSQRPSILMGNHQSFLDILYLGVIMPQHSVIMAKKELRWAPILGQFMMLGGSVFIDRKSRESAVRTMKEAGQTMRKNDLALFAFPEGTRSHSDKPVLLPFKKGIFHLAIETQLPITPIVCENYHHLYDSKSRFEGGEIRVAVLPPVSTQGLTMKDTDALIKQVYDMMLARLKQFGEDSNADKVLADYRLSQKSTHGLAGLMARL
ncbi:1-acylglycerol-3-phosphate O-acyltransferase [Malassezia psittaci]|uniref:1-acyl-sn-glycerol-3-phosphate acyltransferase n=1 Tax=Malassezia psittaci TaxID=1821823 RepID=A0AAF0FAX1_9BASI|nr:1-acylglycerol-3-phosphate O-acyltransferase [Malassezia psittaci]